VPSLEGLDAGTITLTGPVRARSNAGSQFGLKGAFTATLAAGAIPSSGGTFTFPRMGGTTWVLSRPRDIVEPASDLDQYERGRDNR